HAETRGALLQQVAVPPVGLLGGAEAGVLAHGPQPAPVHGGIHTPGEGVLPREAVPFLDASCVVSGVQWLDVDPSAGGEGLAPLAALAAEGLVDLLPPPPVVATGPVDVAHAYSPNQPRTRMASATRRTATM